MSAARQKQSILKVVSDYEALLLLVSEERFIQSPSAAAWSYAETYSHIFQSNMLSLRAMEKCIAGTAVSSIKPTHWIAALILFFGRFPPVKIKAPAKIEAMVQKINKAEALSMIDTFKAKLEELSLNIALSNPLQKAMHPRLGLLNAKQWLRFIEIHTLHHAQQLKRIEKMLNLTADPLDLN